MTALEIFTYAGLLMLGGMVLGYLVAAIKNRDASRWAFICFVCPPAVILLLVRPARKGPRIRRMGWDQADEIDHARHNPPN